MQPKLIDPSSQEYKFSVADPNPPPPPVEEEQDADNLLSPFRRYKYTPAPEPLVRILVRTIDRRKIPANEFYLSMDAVSEVRCQFKFFTHFPVIYVALPLQDFLQFSMGVFNKSGRIKPSLYKPGSPERGTGVWGPEINNGTLAYIEEIYVNSSCRRQGLGRWAIENLLKCDLLVVCKSNDLFGSILTSLKHCPFFFLMAGVWSAGSPFSGPDPDFESKKQVVTSFWHSVGFRRIAGTSFFGYARDSNHPMRSLRVEDDAVQTQTKDYTPLDAFDACVTVIHG